MFIENFMKFFTRVSVFFIVLMCLNSVLGLKAQTLEESAEKFNQVLSYIDVYYVDDTDHKELTDKAINELLLQLDPHSEYFTKEEADELMRDLNGSFEGVGITYSLIHDTIYIISVTKDGPSERVGMLAGDRIVKIEGKTVAGVGITDDYIRDALLGEKGSKVEVSIRRRGQKRLSKLTIERDKIDVNSVVASYMLSDKVAYIKLERFSAQADQEFKDSLKNLQKQGAEHLIFDLRGNTGGYLMQCVSIADQFWRSREFIVATRGENLDERIYESGLQGIFPDGRLVVLIDENSASASEIVAGAVQDLDRGVIVGRRSFGKGLVQRPFRLNDGSLMRLTIARYYTASGRCIQKDFGKDKAEYSAEAYHRDSIESPPDSGKIYYTRNNRKVYGGGAVFPDVFVPYHKDKYSLFYRKLLNTGMVFEKVHLYVDYNRKALTGIYPTPMDFLDRYELSESFVKEIYAAAPDSVTESLPDSLPASLSFNDKVHLKALVASDLWGRENYFKYLNRFSDSVAKALELIADENRYKAILHEPETAQQTTHKGP